MRLSVNMQAAAWPAMAVAAPVHTRWKSRVAETQSTSLFGVPPSTPKIISASKIKLTTPSSKGGGRGDLFFFLSLSLYLCLFRYF